MKKEYRRNKGEGSWTQNGNRSWTYRLGYGTKADGKRKTLTVTAPTKEQCRERMREKKREWDRQNECQVELHYETLTGMCKRYTASKKLEFSSLDREECTIRNQIENYPLGRMQVQAIKPIDIERHIRQLINEGRLSSSSIEKVLDVVNAAYNWAIARREFEYNPVLAIKKELQSDINKLSDKGADDEDVRVLSPAEEKRFREEALARWKNGKDKYAAGLFALLMLYTGMRCGEMISLRWKEVNFEDRIIKIDSTLKTINNRDDKQVNGKIPKKITVESKTKNKKARNIILNDDAIAVLRLIRSKAPKASQNDFVALTRTGKNYTVSEIESRIKTIFRNAGMPQYKGGCHVFRRTFTTNMIKTKNVDTKIVAEYIGDLESTLKKHYFAARDKMITSEGEEIAVVNPWVYQKPKEDSAE